MDIIRFIFVTMGFFGLVLVNATLFIWDEAVRFHSRQSQDGWKLECFYYTPVRTFTVEKDFGQECPQRMRVPGSTKPQGHFTLGGMDERIDSTLPPVFSPKIVPRS